MFPTRSYGGYKPSSTSCESPAWPIWRCTPRTFDSSRKPSRPRVRPWPDAPTLILDAGDALRVSSEEIFGPLLVVRTYARLADALSYIAARPKPLALYYLGPDRAEERRVREPRVRPDHEQRPEDLLGGHAQRVPRI